MADKIRVQERMSQYHANDKYIMKTLETKLSENIFKLLEDGNRYVFGMTINKTHDAESLSYIYTADLEYQMAKEMEVCYISPEELFKNDFHEKKGFWKRCKVVCKYLFSKKYRIGKIEYREKALTYQNGGKGE